MLTSKCKMYDEKIKIYQKARGLTAVKYDCQNSGTWPVINIMIDTNCCNASVFIQIFTMFMDTFKKAKKNQLQY